MVKDRTPEETLQRIAWLHRSGRYTYTQLSRDFGLPRQTVQVVCQRARVRRIKKQTGADAR